MHLVTQSELSNILGVTPQTIYKKVKSGELIKNRDSKDGKIDLHDPVNIRYMQRAIERLDHENIDKNLIDPGTKKSQDEIVVSDLVSLTENINVVSKVTADKLKIVEQIRSLQLKTELERKELISRELVQKLFAKLYIIDTSELKTLGDKIAPDLMAICGVDGNDIQIKINELIEKEVYKILEHIKRLINDFLKKIDAKVIE